MCCVSFLFIALQNLSSVSFDERRICGRGEADLVSSCRDIGRKCFGRLLEACIVRTLLLDDIRNASTSNAVSLLGLLYYCPSQKYLYNFSTLAATISHQRRMMIRGGGHSRR